MNLERLLQEKRQEIFQIAARHGVRNIRVFGSAARGDAGEGSDVDLLIEAGPQRTHPPRWKTPVLSFLGLIEVRTGDCLEEDDIVRLADDFWRVKKG